MAHFEFIMVLIYKRETKTLGILSSQDGNAEVDIKRKKNLQMVARVYRLLQRYTFNSA